jgi:hypothetical protein
VIEQIVYTCAFQRLPHENRVVLASVGSVVI